MGANPSREKSRHSSGDDTGPTMGTGLREGGDYDVYPPMLEGDRGVASYFNKDFDEEAPSLFRPLATPIGDEKRTIPTYLKWIGGGKEVFVSGSFNDWKENIPMVKSRENFYTIVHLSEGTYQYKFYVDGQWKCDPNEPAVDSSVGSKNNMLKVTSADFEVFEALAMDSLTKEEQFSSSPGAAGTHSVTGLSGSPPGEYSQEMPSRSPNQSRHAGPPVLPPHLLQVILNKETPVHCEPTLLPEPNHVMLNHLYALSIKDGVMVLSAAHRYRKKYVTTLLYTPIG